MERAGTPLHPRASTSSLQSAGSGGEPTGRSSFLRMADARPAGTARPMTSSKARRRHLACSLVA